ncbi:hypothetical protein CIK64_10980 [Brevibacterium aurantiacum]|uniref:Uncharacterized protein n=1 Tax=Brevibacterium aurantiacum TaxID=273384 RepID=A0A2A3Z4M0_BREAU|nr:hypothetical protein CIK64_10980 [Brevibacterium aurantiacum]
MALADAVATAIGTEIVGSFDLVSANLVSADLEVKGKLTMATTPTAVVTTVLAERDARVRTEVTAFLNSDAGVAAVLRLAFTSAEAVDRSVSGLLCPGSREWNAELHRRLGDDESFARLIESYDGTIGISIGGRPVHIRCYRGQVLEVVARAVKGADFVLDIPGEVFIDLMSSNDNSFMETAMMGKMRSAGSGYEYLRMTSALIRIIDNARALAGTAGYVGATTTSIETLQVA